MWLEKTAPQFLPVTKTCEREEFGKYRKGRVHGRCSDGDLDGEPAGVPHHVHAPASACEIHSVYMLRALQGWVYAMGNACGRVRERVRTSVLWRPQHRRRPQQILPEPEAGPVDMDHAQGFGQESHLHAHVLPLYGKHVRYA
jgi:hypothetical protein